MFGVSFPELIVVCIVALLIFGPDKLPELARTLGKLSAELRRQSDSVRREFYNSVYKPADDFKGSLERQARSLMSEPVPHKPHSAAPINESTAAAAKELKQDKPNE